MAYKQQAQGRVLKDLTQLSREDIIALAAAAGLTLEQPKQVQITLGEYQGSTTIDINIPGKRPMKIGVGKVRAIYEHEKVIKGLLATLKK